MQNQSTRCCLTVALALAAGAAAAEEFVPGCPLPFAKIQEQQGIDKACGRSGDATDTAHRAQNEAKNQFCAGQDQDLIPIKYGDFAGLQREADKRKQQKKLKFGSSQSLPEDRKVLKNFLSVGGMSIGEGSHVQVALFFLEARPAGKESVNCNKTRSENNDIHIDLGSKAGEKNLCKSVTAEMSPHFRPSSWTQITHKNIHDELVKFPVRITGHLFFDASHTPCHGQTKPSPNRVSIWEIHPVYAFDVCKNTTLASCKIGDPKVWTPLDAWVEQVEKQLEKQ